MNVPFHRPAYDERDAQALLESLRSGKIVGDGDRTQRASAMLARMLEVRHVLLTTSCTHALELAMMVLHLEPDDEVIVPSFTFVSTTNCILRERARVIFADVDPGTLTIDPQDVERKITAKTKAIIPVVYAGVSPDLHALTRFVDDRRIVVVEDAAQGVGAFYRGKPAGTTGTIGCYSFHETKNFSTGEGGAFATDNAEYASRAEIIREKGTNRKQFMQGLVDRYTWVGVGSSYLPPDMVGALLISQLDKREAIQERRESIHLRYMEAFASLADDGFLTLPVIPGTVRSNYHIFHVLMRDEMSRNNAIAFFRTKGVGTTFHYLPLHLSPVGRSLGYGPGDFPVTESASARLLRLPIYPSLTEEEQTHVIRTMQEFALS